MSTVYVAGSINMDIVAGAVHHPVVGETVAGTSLDYYPGGKGANQAVAAAQLGAVTKMVGCLGNDAFASQLRDFLSTKQVDLSSVTALPEGPSGTALIVVAGSENTIVVVPGANDALRPDLTAELPLAAGDVVLAQFETPQDTTRAFFERARESGATTILNPAPAAPFIAGLLETCDLVIVNETELAAIAGLPAAPDPEDRDALAAAVKGARAFFDQTWIVTLGAKGALAFTEGAEPLAQDGHRVAAIDSTGAGDCFVGALAAGLAEGRELPDSLLRANAAAALSVQRRGAGPAMPRAAEVNDFLAASPA